MRNGASLALRSDAPAETGDDEPSSAPRDEEESGAEPRQQSLLQQLKTWLRERLRPDATLHEALDEVIEVHREESGEEPVDAEGRAMLHNILSLHDLNVDDIMTPRADIVAISSGAKLCDIKRLVEENEHTRMPVYRETLDQIVGFIHIKDLIPYLGTDKLFRTDDVLRQLIVVPPSMPVSDLLLRMRKCGVHMALVVDEFGGTDGLVTLEDIFEHIVGDIMDEHDDLDETEEIVALGERDFEVLARTEISTLEEATHMDFSVPGRGEDFDTVSGLIYTLLGRIPGAGERIAHPNGAHFTVLKGDARRIYKVRLDLPPKAE